MKKKINRIEGNNSSTIIIRDFTTPPSIMDTITK